MTFLPKCLCLCPNFSVLVRIPVIGFTNNPNQVQLILTCLHLQRPYFQIRSYSQILEVKISMYFVRGKEFKPPGLCFPFHWETSQETFYMSPDLHIKYSIGRCLYSYCWVAQSCPTLSDPMNCAHQTFLSFTTSWSLLKLMTIESVMPSKHLILLHLLLLSSIFPSIRVFSTE